MHHYITLKELAMHLGVSTKTIYRLIEKELPAVKVGRQWRFYRDEIEVWLKNKGAYVAGNIQAQGQVDAPHVLLSDAVKTGGIFFNVGGDRVAEVIKNAVDIIPLCQKINREELTKAIIAREKLCTTAIGQGIALPHPRQPDTDFDYSRISLCFLKNDVDFGALDQKRVNKLFFVFGKNEKQHLQLLKILVEMLQVPDFIDILENQASDTEILETIQLLEKQFTLKAVANV